MNGELPKINHKHKVIIQYITNYFKNFDRLKIVDAGGAYGIIVDHLPCCNRKVVLDLSYKNLTRYNHSKHEIICGNVYKTNFKDKEFDICIFSEVFEHLNEPEKAVTELCRISKEIIFTTPNNTLIRKVLRFVLNKPPTISMNHIREYGYREVKNMFEKQNFNVISFKGIGFFIPQIHTDNYPRLSAKMLYHFKGD